MRSGPHRLCTVQEDSTGATLVEFGLIAPVFVLVLMGIMDMGHTLYMQSVLQGALQKAARDSTLETASAVATRNAIDDAVEAQVLRIASNATVHFRRTSFRDYNRASNRTKEPFKDLNHNNTCDQGEPFDDLNENGSWDIDNGQNNSGNAKDVVMLNASVQYPRLFPMAKLIGLPAEVKLDASTVLVNQPYGEQRAIKPGNCP